MKHNRIFWVGYSDLMTSIFFVMLVLFVLTIGHLNNKLEIISTVNDEKGMLIDSLKLTNDKLYNILKLEELFKPLEDDDNFIYIEECKKFVTKDLMEKEIFDPNETVIKNEYINITMNVGKKIETFLSELKAKNPNLSYLLIIEGNMANKWDQSIDENQSRGYLTSYNRALVVYNLWLKNGINFRDYNAEVLICGSGFNGLCRDSNEENNKRFSIQIIPKIENRKTN